MKRSIWRSGMSTISWMAFRGRIVVGQKLQLSDKFRIDGLIDEAEKRLRLERHIHKAVPDSRIVVDGQAPLGIKLVFHQRHQLARKGFQGSVIVDRALQHGCRDGKHEALDCKAPSAKNVMDQKAVDSAIAILEWMQENETIGDGSGVDHR